MNPRPQLLEWKQKKTLNAYLDATATLPSRHFDRSQNFNLGVDFLFHPLIWLD